MKPQIITFRKLENLHWDKKNLILLDFNFFTV